MPTVAYFSMEIALESHMPTYSGGLGVLAGDFVRSAADMGFPMVAVSLLPRMGYFYQRLDESGNQHEEPVRWPADDFLELAPVTCRLDVEGRDVVLRCWKYGVRGVSRHIVPVFFLDTDVDGNDPYDRSLSFYLYGGDARYRLCQELVLGVGGVRMLRALGYPYANVDKYHVNEGHAALLSLELLEEARAAGPVLPSELEWVRGRCVFTTHTPVPAGHDRFSLELAASVLGSERLGLLSSLDCCAEEVNMTEVALQLSGYVNGVALSHGKVARSMFPGYPIDSITNGVHSATWAAPSFQHLYNKHFPDWRRNNVSLRYALRIPPEEVWYAHQEAKKQLVEEVNRWENLGMDADVFTIGFARRATAYKRPDLLFRDISRLKEIARVRGPLQIIYSGKAHPQDDPGKEAIRRVFQAQEQLAPEVKVAYMPNYELETARLLVAGSDIWLNTPLPPYEASGTSGMKAAHNGVPSLSVLDGWWREGHVEGVTGWAIGPATAGLPTSERDAADAADLYHKLDEVILPLFYGDRLRWTEVMRHAIAHNAAFFNTQRMLHEYIERAYSGNEKGKS